MANIETSLTDAAKSVNTEADTYGSTNALYKKAAAIASYKLGRGVSEHDVLLVEMAVLEAKMSARRDIAENYSELIRLVATASGLNGTQPIRLAEDMLATVEDNLTDGVKRIAGMFAPKLPNVSDTDSPL
jgi:hypothetical protein